MNIFKIKYLSFIVTLSIAFFACEQNDGDYDEKVNLGQDVYMTVKDGTTHGVYMLELMQRVDMFLATPDKEKSRSEERRVGKEC